MNIFQNGGSVFSGTQGDITGGDAVRHILSRLLDDLLKCESDVRDDVSTESLHNYRVTIRRTRTILGQFKSLMPPGAAAHFSREFRWLGGITGPLRDADVHLNAINRHLGELPTELQSNLKPFLLYLKQHRKQEHQKLLQHLIGSRCISFASDWRVFLHKGISDWGHASQTEAAGVARPRIWRLYKKMLRHGRNIGAGSPASSLHELRKESKKLRYLLEFFDEIYPNQDVLALTKPVRKLQAVLGEHQDLEVQVNALQQFRKDFAGNDTLPVQKKPCLIF